MKETRENPKCDNNSCAVNDHALNIKFSIDAVKIHGDASNLLKLSLVDQIGADKHQIYTHTFTRDELLEINQHESIPMNNFVDLAIDCLTDKEPKYSVSYKIIKNQQKHYLQVNIAYKPDKYTSKIFAFDIPAKKMNEIDILKLRIQELEANMLKLQSFIPILFTASTKKHLAVVKAGWNNIILNDCSDDNNEYIKFDKDNGYIKLAKGTYSIEAEATVVYVDGNVIQLKSVKDDGIKIYGSLQYSRHGQNSWETTVSRIPRQTIIVDESLTLMLRVYTQTAYSTAMYFDPTGVHHPKELLQNNFASVTVQRILT